MFQISENKCSRVHLSENNGEQNKRIFISKQFTWNLFIFFFARNEDMAEYIKRRIKQNKKKSIRLYQIY